MEVNQIEAEYNVGEGTPSMGSPLNKADIPGAL